MKAVPAGFADGLNTEYERKRSQGWLQGFLGFVVVCLFIQATRGTELLFFEMG